MGPALLLAWVNQSHCVRAKGVRIGNWLSMRQAQTLLPLIRVITILYRNDGEMIATTINQMTARRPVARRNAGPWPSCHLHAGEDH
jgi:hypothetical protein